MEEINTKMAAAVIVVDVKEKCKERLIQGRKNILKKMILSDQLDMRDPQLIAEYA